MCPSLRTAPTVPMMATMNVPVRRPPPIVVDNVRRIPFVLRHVRPVTIHSDPIASIVWMEHEQWVGFVLSLVSVIDVGFLECPITFA